MITAETDCYFCGSPRSSPYATENGFNLVKCGDCGLLYVSPRPVDEEIAEAHECGIHRGEENLNMSGTFSEQKVESYCEILKDLYGSELGRRERTWLDIGCGHGEFLVALRKVSSQKVVVTGLEPNRKKQLSATSRGLNVSHFNLQNHRDQYDMISLLNVYSHLPNPREFLLLCTKLIKPHGELLLETGDTAHLPPEEHYRPFHLPDHLSFASEEIVSSILENSGLQVVLLRKYPAFPFKYGGFIWLKEAVKAVCPGRKSQMRELIGEYRKSRKYITDMYFRSRKSVSPFL